jgi:hypothetical protein
MIRIWLLSFFEFGFGIKLYPNQPNDVAACMPVPKLVCEVSYASGFASCIDDDVPWDTRSYVRKARPNSIALEKGDLGTHMRAEKVDDKVLARFISVFCPGSPRHHL